jgi:hypothetical protein
MASLVRRILLPAGSLCLFVLSVAQPDPVAQHGLFTYRFDNSAYVQSADSTLTATRQRLQSLLRSDMAFEAEVYLVESQPRFDSLAGGKFPDWGVAAAIPHWRRIVIRSPDTFRLNRPLAELLAHEYSHLALAHRTDRRRVPRWLDEGLAMVVSMEWAWADNLTMSLAAVMGHFIPFDEIERVNRFGQNRARIAYAQSYMTVQYLFDQYGIEGVNILLDSLATDAGLDSALMASTGSNYADFEAELRVYLQGRFNLLSLMTDTMYFWLALAIILIVGAILSLRRRRRYLRKWEKEEQLASTDFDYGDPQAPEKLDDDDEPWRH